MVGTWMVQALRARSDRTPGRGPDDELPPIDPAGWAAWARPRAARHGDEVGAPNVPERVDWTSQTARRYAIR